MARTRREKILDITREEIKDIARQLMAEKGTAGISVRAIQPRKNLRNWAWHMWQSNWVYRLPDHAVIRVTVSVISALKTV